MKNLKRILSLAVLAAGLTLDAGAQTPPAPAAAPDPGTIRSAIDLFRADLKIEKALIVAKSLVLTDDESAEFWPLYSEYHAASVKLLDERLVLLKDYVAIYDSITDDQAATLAGKVFDWEGKRTALKRAWFKKFTEVVPAKKAAQFFQIDNQINAALDLLLMDALPLIK